MRESLELTSNVTLERSSQPTKHPWQMVSTEDGMEIDGSNEHPEKAAWPICETLDPVSNVNDVRCPQCEKQSLEMVVTEEGMQIEDNEEQCENAAA
jgi:hypothetical protein